ncbi:MULTISPECIES: hypothetical protein [unclassified Nodularia (in: cyanobacteria)]|uniref:hypothetical protein n=1 Tax=unclassified Nodularia (in: cyanobacteria) TaxID=2656917 RepID=UPI00187ED80B|nr:MULTISPECIES: hypothetical protein [unclassified Nodularia (in: cyanobacteria)]MBE9200855.1 hypothetical protein [Nodularia sp. LEGE 06071]MCC2692345.1 hypothetical protein [Nodularia sp. LEGE 04288]
MLEILIPMVINKSVEVVVGILLAKFFKSVLSDANIKIANNFLKMQIVLLYLDWVLLKTPLESLPEESQER